MLSVNIDRLITIDMVSLDFEASFKEEVLQEICAQLFFLKRTDSSGLLYKDIIAREKIVSTFAGNMMAIPHTISANIKEASLYFIRLKNHIIWNAADENVKYILLLAAPYAADLNRLRQEQSYIFSSIAQAISQTDILTIWHQEKDKQKIFNSFKKILKTNVKS